MAAEKIVVSGLSQYVNNLPLDAKVRYQKKISLLENIDSYQIDEWTEDKYCLAEVQHEDIVNFLLFSTSYYIFEEMKAFKII